MKQSVLASLAFLKINSDNNRSIFLDNFIPFIAEVLRLQSTEAVSVPNLQASLRDTFGLTIPHHVVKTLLFRARKRGYVSLKDRIFYRDNTKLASSSFSSTQKRVQAIYAALVDSFIGFSRSEFGASFNEQEAEQLIIAFIGYNQLYIYQLEGIESIIPNLPSLSQQNKVIVSQFIVHAKERNPSIFDFLDTVVKGYMIANVLYLPDINNIEKRFRKTKVFLDTPLILFVLGYSGKEMQAPALELLDLLYANGAQLCCFRHTVEEIKGILDACAERLGSAYKGSTFGLSLKHFISLGYRPSDIVLLISHLENNIQSCGIKILPTPDYSKGTHIIDEQGLKNTILENWGVPRERAIERDVASISAIYRLRKGQVAYGVEEAIAIFLTTNDTLSRLANEQYYRDNPRYSAPPCITDFALTTLLWLKTPSRAPELPMKRIIADSYAAIQPDDELMGKWIAEIGKLEDRGDITEEDYLFFRYSNEAHISLMESTLGQSAVITEGSVAQIMERARDKIREEAKMEIASLMREKRNTEAKLSQFIAQKRQQEQDQEIALRNLSRRLTKGIFLAAKAATILLLVFLVFVSLPVDLLANGLSAAFEAYPRFVRGGIFIALLGIGTYSLYYGNSALAILQGLESRTANRVHRILRTLRDKFLRTNPNHNI